MSASRARSTGSGDASEEQRDANVSGAANVAPTANPDAEPEIAATEGETKTLVWRGGSDNHARVMSPDSHSGLSQEYRWDRNNEHTITMSAADADLIMKSPDKGEFRVKK
jgi:hypothetical protein